MRSNSALLSDAFPLAALRMRRGKTRTLAAQGTERTMQALSSFLRLTETVLRLCLKLMLVFVAGIVAFIAALTWKR